MTPDQRTMAIWGGGAGALVIAGWIVLAMRGDSLAQATAQAKQLHRSYVQLYHPDRPDAGVPEAEARRSAANLRSHQDEALRQAENVLVATLPEAYLATDLTSASSQARTDFEALKTRSSRQGIPIPALPFESGLSQKETGFARELAYIHLCRFLLDACMEVKGDRVGSLVVGPCRADPSGRYATFAIDAEIEAKYERVLALLTDLRASHGRGMGVREVAIQQNRDGGQRVRLTVSMITLNREIWDLKPEDGGLPATTPRGGATPAAGGGGRLNRL